MYWLGDFMNSCHNVKCPKFNENKLRNCRDGKSIYFCKKAIIHKNAHFDFDNHKSIVDTWLDYYGHF